MNVLATFGSWLAQLGAAVFADVPFLIDDYWRRAEFVLNRTQAYDAGAAGTKIATIARWRTAAFGLLVLVLIFIIYGPTFSAFCSVGGELVARLLFTLPGAGMGAVALLIGLRFGRNVWQRCRERVATGLAGTLRRRAFRVLALMLLVIGPGAAALLAAYQMLGVAWSSDSLPCHATAAHGRALLQLAGVGGVLALAWVVTAAPLGSRAWTYRVCLYVGAVCVAFWLLAGARATEASQGPYRHLYAALAFGLVAIALLAPRWADRVFRTMTSTAPADFAQVLQQSELFVRRPEPDVSPHRLIHAVINGPLYHPFQLLLLPSLVTLMAPDDRLWFWTVSVTAVSVLMLTWGSMSSRWRQMVLHVDRWFFTGSAYFISLGVIGLAIARLLEVHYVASLLAAAPFGTIFTWVVMVYALFWLFEYLINEPLGARLLSLLGPAGNAATTFIRYPFIGSTTLSVAPDERYVAVHGAGRLAVVGTFTSATATGMAFHTYGNNELFHVLATAARAIPGTSPALTERVREAANEVDRRSKLYFNVLNLLVLVLLGGFVYHVTEASENQNRAVVVEAPVHAGGAFDLAAALKARGGRPAIVVAASGGGTRAALYVRAVLRGLAQAGAADDIVLASGVSGGGAALAYFASHRQELLSDAAAWEAFGDTMSESFIGDVLAGAMEWRIIGEDPLSALLAESFERRLAGAVTFAEVRDLGLILNTTVTGHPPGDSAMVANLVGRPCRAYSRMSGNRLAFTNLKDVQAFPRSGVAALPDVEMAFRVVSDPAVRIARAAALNANFPPVFPNARVDLAPTGPCPTDTYYVTDGGATENLGLISALYALEAALATLTTGEIPTVHVVVAEASAVAIDYGQDRGIGAATGGAKERLAGALTGHLIGELRARLGARAPIEYHFLGMPAPFRLRGGLGTHWMLPPTVALSNPHDATPDCCEPRVTLDRTAIRALLDELHAVPPRYCADGTGGARVRDWICGRSAPTRYEQDPHVAAWRTLVDALGAAPPLAALPPRAAPSEYPSLAARKRERR